MILSELIKFKREAKGMLHREVAYMVDVDTALISKIEKADRKPTKEQIEKLSLALDIEYKKLLTLWLSEKAYKEVEGEEMALDAIKLVVKRIKEK